MNCSFFPVVPHGAKRECRLVSSSVLDRDCVFRTDDGSGQHRDALLQILLFT